MTSQKDRIREQVLRARQKQESDAPSSSAREEDDGIREQSAPPSSRKTPAPEVKAPTRTSKGTHTPRLRPVRKNVDLSPDLNRRFGDWQRDTAIELGLARVTAQDVLTELLIELLGDPLLSERIKERLHESVDQ
ncbi:hypothetical protein [Rhodococcus artemisiae]|uniref:ATPase n=1 Tax=Rhodococcus artemisiae TaxID=714159 RepID=A0ABU7LJW4_9NOCA|nr:hypothetical protein [Rhodococcus artemisiae]MEE2061834.1 hypothetical protein [Rhodococcus artemisiae]